jgi:hypothetical protein
VDGVYRNLHILIVVSKLMGWVRNVVLIEYIFGSGKPRGVGISGKGPHGLSEGNGESVYEQPRDEVDGSCHDKEGSK